MFNHLFTHYIQGSYSKDLQKSYKWQAITLEDNKAWNLTKAVTVRAGIDFVLSHGSVQTHITEL